MPIQMLDGSSAHLLIRHGGKQYRPIDGAFPQTALVRGEFDHAGMLIAEDAGQNRFGFIEAHTIVIQMRNGETATYTEGDTGVYYQGQFYQGCEDGGPVFSAETSTGCLQTNPNALVISTSAGGRLEHIYFYRV
jgi:hypothetical protein